MLTPKLRPGTIAFQWNTGTPKSFIEEFERKTELIVDVWPEDGQVEECASVYNDYGNVTLYDGDFVIVYADRTIEVLNEAEYVARYQ